MKPPHPKGMVLILAMLGLAMLTVFAVTLGFGTRQKAALLDRLTTLDALYPIAYSGVENAKNLVRADFDTSIDTLADPWGGSALQEVEMMNGRFILGSEERPGLRDEESKININKVSSSQVAVLQRLLKGPGQMEEGEADALAYCIIDWADSDPFFGHPQYGAEDSDYREFDLPYEAKDRPYETLDELLLVKGMTRPVFDRIRPYLTVFGLGPVNINTVSAEVLQALGMDEDGALKITRWRAGTDGKEGTADDNLYTQPEMVLTELQDRAETPLDGEQATMFNNLIVSPGIGVTSFFFQVDCRAVLERDGSSMTAEAVIDRRGNTHYFRITGSQV